MKRLTVLVVLALLIGGCGMLRRRAANRPPFKKLSPPIAYEMIRDNPDMLILDLRPAAEFNGATGHIRRAKNIPMDRLPFRLLEISAFREDTVLVYCGQPDCAEQGMAVLLASGFENAILMDGGIDRWIREGFKTVLPQSVANPSGGPDDGRGALRPQRPGETNPQTEAPAVPPPPPLHAGIAAPRQIGYNHSHSIQGDPL
jgi:rhodanese-related sulfurtransferase